jgi:hypothetical protein
MVAEMATGLVDFPPHCTPARLLRKENARERAFSAMRSEFHARLSSWNCFTASVTSPSTFSWGQKSCQMLPSRWSPGIELV